MQGAGAPSAPWRLYARMVVCPAALPVGNCPRAKRWIGTGFQSSGPGTRLVLPERRQLSISARDEVHGGGVSRSDFERKVFRGEAARLEPGKKLGEYGAGSGDGGGLGGLEGAAVAFGSGHCRPDATPTGVVE